MGRIRIILSAVFVLVLFRLSAQGPGGLEFIENKGQWEQGVKFKSPLSGGAFFLESRGFTVLQHQSDDLARLHERMHSGSKRTPGSPGLNSATPEGIRSTEGDTVNVRSHAYRVRFEGGAANPQVLPDKPLPHYNNYFLGDDPTKWVSQAKIYSALVYKNVYPNIDVRYYSEGGRLKYDIIVYPGGNPEQIAMHYEGADKLSVSKEKELLIRTSVGEIRELYPYSYQYESGKNRKEIQCRYDVSGNTVRFKLKGYDSRETLVIDPSVVFCSYTGGSNNYGFTATPGPDGSFYSGSITFDDRFPVTPGAFQTGFGGGGGAFGQACDMGIIKFNANGTARVYATYIGGNKNDFPHSLFCDPQGNLVVMGRSYSPNYPTTAVAGNGGGCDIVVTKLNAAGSGIIGSMRIGGDLDDGVNIQDNYNRSVLDQTSLLQNYGDESRSEVVLDAAGNIYVAGNSQSSNFPVTAGVFQGTKGANQDGVVFKLNPNCNGLLWASYIGGNNNDGAFVLEIDPANGDVYVGGATASTNFPVKPAGSVIQSIYQGGAADGFVAVINNTGTTLKYATYIGTGNTDIIYGIKFDRFGFPHIMGTTRGTMTPVNAAYAVPGSKQFVAKLNPDLSSYAFLTVFGNGGSKPNISPVAFLVDRCGNMYISGWGGWIDNQADPFDMGNLSGMPLTADAIKKVTDNKDFYFIVIKKDASALLYGTYYGQDGGEGEHVDGGTSRFDQQGVIYQGICANCFGDRASIPWIKPPAGFQFTTPGVVAETNGAGNNGCNLGALKISFNFSGVASGPKAFINGVPDSIGCAPLTFQLKDTILNAKSYEWNFGDGSPDVITTVAGVNHTYATVGSYRIRLIAVDSTTCNIRDTAYINVRVGNDQALLAFNPVKQLPCESLSYRFDNTSAAPIGKPFKNNSFTWDFGDGTRITTGNGSLTHSFGAPGTYKVRLILADTSYCNSPDSLETTLRIAPNVDALFETPLTGCAPYTAVFKNTSVAGIQFIWDFGDGNSSTAISPTHLYPNVGTYRVKMYALDSNTCNKIDSAEQLITVNGKPTADFSFTPVTPVLNTPTIFTNLSVGGIRYKWLFGDGDSTIKNTLDTTLHQYNTTGTFNACLVVYNAAGCTDTICKPVQALIEPLLDVPNAFTPGRFGQNSVIKVAGFGISKMTWKIYNRWGQLVFESTDRKLGWDGSYQGKPQPMDVYAYTLDVEFFDGKKTRKTGDITLIR